MFVNWLVQFFTWAWAVLDVAGSVFGLFFAYCCLRGYIDVHFPDDDGRGMPA